MKLNLTEEQKKAALEAGKQGMKNAYEKSKYRPGDAIVFKAENGRSHLFFCSIHRFQ